MYSRFMKALEENHPDILSMLEEQREAKRRKVIVVRLLLVMSLVLLFFLVPFHEIAFPYSQVEENSKLSSLFKIRNPIALVSVSDTQNSTVSANPDVKVSSFAFGFQL